MKKAIVLSCVAVAACTRPVPEVKPDIHYVVGRAWQAGGFWVYPRGEFSYQATGLAEQVGRTKDAPQLTTDGEVRSDLSMTASHPTLQLPAIVTVTNLENGHVVRVRLNDRGPDKLGRLLGVTPKVASLLGMTNKPARIRIVEDEMASRRMAETLPGGPLLQISKAPREDVMQTALSGTNAAELTAGNGLAVDHNSVASASDGAASRLVDVPVAWWQSAPVASELWVETSDFTSRFSAAREAAREGGSVVPAFAAQGKMWAVRHGPFATISEADAALKRSLADGLTGSHIVVE